MIMRVYSPDRNNAGGRRATGGQIRRLRLVQLLFSGWSGEPTGEWDGGGMAQCAAATLAPHTRQSESAKGHSSSDRTHRRGQTWSKIVGGLLGLPCRWLRRCWSCVTCGG